MLGALTNTVTFSFVEVDPYLNSEEPFRLIKIGPLAIREHHLPHVRCFSSFISFTSRMSPLLHRFADEKLQGPEREGRDHSERTTHVPVLPLRKCRLRTPRKQALGGAIR